MCQARDINRGTEPYPFAPRESRPMIELPSNALEEAATTLAGKGAVSMINLNRYRQEADYGDRSAPCTGREAYLQRYAPEFAKVAELVAPGQHFAPVFVGKIQAILLGPEAAAWDEIVIVEYASFELLRAILESPEYEAQAALHRRAALEDWCFIATTKVEIPG